MGTSLILFTDFEHQQLKIEHLYIKMFFFHKMLQLTAVDQPAVLKTRDGILSSIFFLQLAIDRISVCYRLRFLKIELIYLQIFYNWIWLPD